MGTLNAGLIRRHSQALKSGLMEEAERLEALIAEAQEKCTHPADARKENGPHTRIHAAWCGLCSKILEHAQCRECQEPQRIVHKVTCSKRKHKDPPAPRRTAWERLMLDENDGVERVSEM